MIKKLTEKNDCTRKLKEVFKKPCSEDEKTQTPAFESLQITKGTQSLRDTPTILKIS